MKKNRAPESQAVLAMLVLFVILAMLALFVILAMLATLCA
jgi:hypothetical protein